ncbi:unnamed protein product [Acanthoscelides obtectus]|uniref:Uncharacterized protein n=1 Tax=Acanthoscelides obtectus TaxID=200917 RepID=A0A9P0JJI3_ACAOB|nr:unnamed protein product [Acanthoscelides obtectus]CAK1661324.1 SIN3-HDAC complex-associated factor [Acanthoscelides obtectus]
MFSQTKMQLWYPKSEEKIKEKMERKRIMESEKSEGEFLDVDYLSEDSTDTLNHSDGEEETYKKCKKTRDCSFKEQMTATISDFVDPAYWKKELLCCGIIFRGLHNEVMIDLNFLKPCPSRRNKNKK